jgi:ABC-type nitrate/sulfonate/bicarbonate transport system permease component
MNAKVKRIILFILITLLVILIWEYLINYFNIPKRVIPKPTDLFHFIQKEFLTSHSSKYQTILLKTLISIKDAFVGFILAFVVSLGLGITLAQSKKVYAILFPLIFLTQLVPVPALAPVIATMLGYGYTTKIFIITLFLIFPISISVRNCILNIPISYLDLFKTYSKNEINKYRYLIFPSLVPTLLSQMKVVSTASIVATIITELPLSVRGGIGKDIYNSFNNQMIPRVWVSVMLISLLSFIIFKIFSLLEVNINRKYKYGQY